jgi:Ca2+-binding EF-hand superfamily protein
MAVLENWEIDNLTNYFDSEGKGYVKYAEFAKKFDNTAEQTDLNYYVS